MRCILIFVLAFMLILISLPAHAQIANNGVRITASHYVLSVDNDQHLLNIVDTNSSKLIRQIPLKNRQGKLSTMIFLFHSVQRQSVIASLPEINELWEMRYKEPAEPVYEGLVHDYQMGEGIADAALFAPRRMLLELSLTCFAFDKDGTYVAGANLHGRLQIINVDVRRKIVDYQFLNRVYPCESNIEHTQNGSVLYLHAEEKLTDNRHDEKKNNNATKLFLIEMKSGRILKRVDIL